MVATMLSLQQSECMELLYDPLRCNWPVKVPVSVAKQWAQLWAGHRAPRLFPSFQTLLRLQAESDHSEPIPGESTNSGSCYGSHPAYRYKLPVSMFCVLVYVSIQFMSSSE